MPSPRKKEETPAQTDQWPWSIATATARSAPITQMNVAHLGSIAVYQVIATRRFHPTRLRKKC